MNELIKITTNEEGKQLVSARELHEGLEIGTQFTKWFNRMCDYGFEENVDYILVSQKRLTNNPKNPITTINDYAISLDMAKEISMLQRNELGKKFRKYFIECEKKLKEVAQPKLPTTYIEALEQLVASEKEKLALQERQEKLIHSTKTYTTTELAKELGYKSAMALNKELHKRGIQYKQSGTWVLYSKYSDKGYVSIKQTILDDGRVIYNTKWTSKGRDWLINEVLC